MRVKPGDFFMFFKLSDYSPLDAVAGPAWQARMDAAREAITKQFPHGRPLPPPPSFPTGGAPAPSTPPASAPPAGPGMLGRLGRGLTRAGVMYVPQAAMSGVAEFARGDTEFGPADVGEASALRTGLQTAGAFVPGAPGFALQVAPAAAEMGGAVAGRATSGWDLPNWLANFLDVESAGTGQAAELGDRAKAKMKELGNVTVDDIHNMRIQESKPKGPAGPGQQAAVRPPAMSSDLATRQERKGDEPAGWQPAWARPGGDSAPQVASAPKVEAPKIDVPKAEPLKTEAPPVAAAVKAPEPLKIQGLKDVEKWQPGQAVEVAGVKAGPQFLEWSKSNPDRARDKITARLPALT